ncbi:hypothetical protein RHGRI_021914 [Rhododendron griersonianum]|uniref:Serpin domain-containing protein n=1 Tax=Rhododendron griersonianum TaxID=479676 RepID=A0AAV6JRQ5_9ERIC|nr:hypothetical protein RHGRI_021914 [Rhododendron griersonianum]
MIQVVLGLIAYGSNGPTQAQLLSLLNSDSADDINFLSSHLVSHVFADGSPTGGSKLSFAMGFRWTRCSISRKPSFKQVVDTVYKATSNHVDFQTKAIEVTNEVNQWAEKETNGLIKEISLYLLYSLSLSLPEQSKLLLQQSLFQNSLPQLPNKMDLKQLIRNQTDVSLSFAKQVSQSKSMDSNLVFSPPLIHIGLGLIAAGSKGQTQSQVLSFLGSKSTDDLNSLTSQLVSLVFADGGPTGGPTLSYANGVWVDQSLSLKPSFKKVVDTVYKAALNHVDFCTQAVEVTNEVNQWAEKETNGLIKEVLPSDSVDDSTRLIFANALYFKGAWIEKFDASETKDQEFHLLNGSSVQVPFMTSKEEQFVSAFNSFKVLKLPYKQGEDKRRFSMYFFLPNARGGLSALMEKVSSESGFLDRHLPCRREEVGRFRIPKFKFSFGFEASEVLKGLGLVLPFSPGEARLTEMVESTTVGRNLYVSSIFHKACIEVNEEGTEAAAASALGLRVCCSREKIDFVTDHPFLFVIREDMTGAVLFIGQVLNPLAD